MKTRGKENIKAVGKNITWKEKRKRNNIFFPLILRLLGKIQSEEKGLKTLKKIIIKKDGIGENINLQGTIYRSKGDTPDYFFLYITSKQELQSMIMRSVICLMKMSFVN